MEEEFFENRILKPLPDYSFNPELKELALSIQNEIINVNPGVNFAEIVGLDEAKRLQEIPAGPYDTNQYASSELFKNTFCSIVNLSTFAEPFPCYDEKPLNAIFNIRPFILCGPPGSLALMRKDGFKTFGDFWDESYDDELDHTKRLEKIFELINEIDSWSIRDCQEIYTNMIPTLFENFHKFKKPNI